MGTGRGSPSEKRSEVDAGLLGGAGTSVPTVADGRGSVAGDRVKMWYGRAMRRGFENFSGGKEKKFVQANKLKLIYNINKQDLWNSNL
jgi:hypothetical protein